MNNVRLDEEMLLLGLTWREAASISNEAEFGAYAIAGRVQLALDMQAALEITAMHWLTDAGE